LEDYLERMNSKDSFGSQCLDLRGTPCPVNFIRSSLAVEKLNNHESLTIYLDKGEPEKMVLSGLEKAGHVVKVISEDENWLTLKVRSSAG